MRDVRLREWSFFLRVMRASRHHLLKTASKFYFSNDFGIPIKTKLFTLNTSFQSSNHLNSFLSRVVDAFQTKLTWNCREIEPQKWARMGERLSGSKQRTKCTDIRRILLLPLPLVLTSSSSSSSSWTQTLWSCTPAIECNNEMNVNLLSQQYLHCFAGSAIEPYYWCSSCDSI